VSELPPLPDGEIGEQLRNFLTEQQACLEVYEARITELEKADEEIEEEPNQVVHGYTERVTGTPDATFPDYERVVGPTTELTLAELTVDAEQGNLVYVLADFSVLTGVASSVTRLKLYVDDVQVAGQLFGAQTTVDNPNNYKYLKYQFESNGPRKIHMTFEGTAAVNYYYNIAGACILTAFEIKE